jgi:formylglycine-generating enzyme required for sulfatase activity
MKEENRITQQDIDQASVKLGPVAGVSPRVYVPLAWGLILLFAIFAIFIYPGIRNYGSLLVFEGSPGMAAVYIEGRYAGSTAQRIPVPAGRHAVRIERLGFAPEETTLNVGGRLFGSLFAPRLQHVPYTLSLSEPAMLVGTAFAEYAAWSLTGKPSALYQIPMAASEAAAALGESAYFRNTPSGIAQVPLAKSLLAATGSAESARDGLRAATILASGGIAGPAGLVAAARLALSAMGNASNAAAWLKDMSPSLGAAASRLAPSSTAAGASPGPVPQPAGTTSFAGHEFVIFSAGTVTMNGTSPSGSRLPHVIDLPSFGMAVKEVSNSQWAAFIRARPKWAPGNRTQLVSEGLADDDYLAGWKGSDEYPVTGVSWHAARAYCEWLNSLSGSSWKAVLPDEAMWEAAAGAGLGISGSGTGISSDRAIWSDEVKQGPEIPGSVGRDRAGLADMFGNVWEWTSSSFLPYPAFAASLPVAATREEPFAADEKTVRGGSWANAPDSISLISRGGQASAHSSAFLGFRPALVSR